MSNAGAVFKKEVESLIALFKELSTDVMLAQKARTEADTPSARRTYLRAMFAAIEELTFSMKHVTLASIPFKNAAFSPEEIRLLQDQFKPFPSWEENFRNALSFYARVLNPGYRPAFDHHGWGCLKASNKMRNRITHPKDVAALTISDQEMAAIETGKVWYFETAQGLLLPWVA